MVDFANGASDVCALVQKIRDCGVDLSNRGFDAVHVFLFVRNLAGVQLSSVPRFQMLSLG